MTRLIPVFICLLLTVFLPTVLMGAQQPKKIPRIGWLTNGSLSNNSYRQHAFRQGLKELGYVEGRNILIEWRGADNIRERRKFLAQELVGLNVDVIVTAGSDGTRNVKELTSKIPIVMASDNDPVANGFAASLARPGGNITGLSQVSPELSGKRLEILKEALPKLSRLALFGSSSGLTQGQVRKEIEVAAAVFGVKVEYFDVLAAKDVESAFRFAVNGHADAVLEVISGSVRNQALKELAEFAVKSRLPVMRERPEHVEAGGLMSYGVNLIDLDRRSAMYVDKILRGAKPGDLPIEQPTKFTFIINLKTAKQIGVTIPPNVLARADRVVQ